MVQLIQSKGENKMSKKEIIATCLAGAIALGCVSGCSNKNEVIPNEEITTVEELSDGYFVEVISATVRENENGEKRYFAPNSTWQLIGDKCYRVVQEYSYPATVIVNEDGTKSYCAPNGGNVSGSVAYVTRTVDPNSLESMSILHEYLGFKGTKRLSC